MASLLSDFPLKNLVMNVIPDGLNRARLLFLAALSPWRLCRCLLVARGVWIGY